MYLQAFHGIGDIDSPQIAPAQPSVFVNVPRGVTAQPAPTPEDFPILDFSTPEPPPVVVAPEPPPSAPSLPPQPSDAEMTNRAVKVALLVAGITGIVSLMLKGR